MEHGRRGAAVRWTGVDCRAWLWTLAWPRGTAFPVDSTPRDEGVRGPGRISLQDLPEPLGSQCAGLS